jgi:hypothetical protein
MTATISKSASRRKKDDAAPGRLYFLDLGGGRVLSSNPDGSDLKTIIDEGRKLLFDNLPEPIDLDPDSTDQMLYWTDRGDPPRGNTVNRAPTNPPQGNREVREIVFSHLMEGIGLALDVKGGRMFVTDLGGSVYSANLDGSDAKTLLIAQGNLTGIAVIRPLTERAERSARHHGSYVLRLLATAIH